MRIRGSGPGQPLRSRRVGDGQRAVVTRIVQVTEDEPALPEDSAIEDREPVARIPMPVPRASHIYTPRVGPQASSKKRELRDDMQIVVDRNWRQGKTLSVVIRLHLKKCGKT